MSERPQQLDEAPPNLNLPETQQLPPFRSAALKVLAAQRIRRGGLNKQGSSLSTILSNGSAEEEREAVYV